MKVTIICPFYNEEKIIRSSCINFINNISKQFKNWELILVNDGSLDNSLKVLISTLDNYLNIFDIKVISYNKNLGRGAALKKGIDHASGDIIITTEIDGSWGNKICKQIFDKITKGPYDAIFASPHLNNGGFKNVPINRIILSKVINKIINIVFYSDITMSTGMTRGYKKETIQQIYTNEAGKEFHLEVLLKLKLLNKNIGEIPATITWPKVTIRKSSTRVFRTVIKHLKFLLNFNPIKIAYFMSLITYGFSILFMLSAIILFFNARIPSIYSIILSVLFFIGGSLFLILINLLINIRAIERNQYVLKLNNQKIKENNFYFQTKK
jgi:glycosyltransferase involved in cell wall biosynthesis